MRCGPVSVPLRPVSPLFCPGLELRRNRRAAVRDSRGLSRPRSVDVTSSPRTRSRTMSMGVSGRSLSSDGTRTRTRPWLSVRRRHLRRLTNREADAWEIPRAAASSAGAVHGGILAITRRVPERPALWLRISLRGTDGTEFWHLNTLAESM
jgi:hypothetical protein